MKIRYREKSFRAATLSTIDQANVIINEYLGKGFKLTLRQLYYQFVARGLLQNKIKEYTRLGGIISDGRLAGLIDWDSIEDRTRSLQRLGHWTEPRQLVQGASESFRVDKWVNQENRLEVWIEKEALAGVFEEVCDDYDVPFFCCRGYTSQSEMWAAAMRLKYYNHYDGQNIIILHFGDHDPSGIHMTQDIIERLQLFGTNLEVERLALNMDQVEEWEPPPNPAKTADPRFDNYLIEYGSESWELDALDPEVLAELVRENVGRFIDWDKWDESEEEIEDGRRILRSIHDNFEGVRSYLNENDLLD